MSNLLNLLNVNTTFFTILGYQMSYIEFFGTLANLACVWLVAKKHILNWPIGIIGVLLFGTLFYQLHLYADLSEQVYYLITGFWGWYVWAKRKTKAEDDQNIIVTKNTDHENQAWIITAILGTIVYAWAMSNIHIWLPSLFPEPASFVLLDVFTTVLSFIAQYLLIIKRLENWPIWIVVDVIGVGLYAKKGVPFVALLYLIFLFLAIKGYITWRKTYEKQ
ncbi:nicotinamide mononucleotide transporter [Candidatus Saccharibacteria bacterium]|jgi:nicotinamide mononucleotide transporter|nr:MAG: nicotinamide mononucleotide transporter [Candidatus Saccharibacteria bacterium]